VGTGREAAVRAGAQAAVAGREARSQGGGLSRGEKVRPVAFRSMH
jgi:hypothetical protein